MKKAKLRTSEDVIARITWDARYDASEYTIEYEDRFLGIMELPLVEYIPGGEIPFHRIWKVKLTKSGIVVWDRKPRKDFIYESGETTQAEINAFKQRIAALQSSDDEEEDEESTEHTDDQESKKQVVEKKPDKVVTKTGKVLTPYAYKQGKKVTFKDASWYRWADNAWQQIDSADSPHNKINADAKVPETLKVATYNILFDLYHTTEIRTADRIPFILEHLQKVNADIYCLQEVTLPFWQNVLQSPFIRDNYYVTESYQGNTITPYGQTILSKFPFLSVRLGRFSRHKCVPIAQLQLQADRKLLVAAIHLTSTAKGALAETAIKQAYQFNTILNAMTKTNTAQDVIIAGDFNFGDGDGNNRLIPTDFVDIGAKEGLLTYDPSKNIVAKIMSTSGRKVRLDRILLRSDTWYTSKSYLFGHEPVLYDDDDASKPVLFASDHFGFCSELVLGTLDPVIRYLKKNKAFDSPQRSNKRNELVQTLEEICCDLVSKATGRTYTGNCVYALGSYAIGVTTPNSDLDLLCIGPSVLDSATFFQMLASALGDTPKELRIVQDAIVPVMKMKLDGIAVDLLYAAYPKALWKSISDTGEGEEEEEEGDDNNIQEQVILPSALTFDQLQLFDTTSQRSIVGVRDCAALLESVRETSGVETYRSMLRAVRYWAAIRGVDSGSLGYLGGISWAILVQYFLMQCKPDVWTKTGLERLVYEFFKFARDFPFEKRTVAITRAGKRYSRQKAPKDRMAIATVSEPVFNSVRNGSFSSLYVLRAEFKRAAEVMDTILSDDDKNTNEGDAFRKACRRSTIQFLEDYDRYVLVNVHATKGNDAKASIGYVDSHLVAMVFGLEKLFRENEDGVFHARVASGCFMNLKSLKTDSHPCTSTHVIGLSWSGEDKTGLDSMQVEGVLRVFESEFNQWKGRPESTDINVKLMRQSKLVAILPKRCFRKLT